MSASFDHFFIEQLVVDFGIAVLNTIINSTNFLDGELAETEALIVGELGLQTQTLQNDSDKQTSAILNSIGAIAGLVGTDAQLNTARIIDQLTGVVAAENRASTEATGRVIAPLSNQLFNIDSDLALIDTRVVSGLSGVNSTLDSLLDVFSSGLSTVINNEIIIDRSIFDSIIGQVSSVVNDANRVNAGVMENLSTVFGGVISDLVSGLFQERARENPQLAEIVAAILHNKDFDSAILGNTASSAAGGFGGTLIESVLNQLGADFELSADDIRKSYDEYLAKNFDLACFGVDEIDQMTFNTGTDYFKKLVVWLVSELATGVLLPLSAMAWRNKARMYEFQACNPNQPLPPAESLMALYRRIISPDEATLNIMKQGFNLEDASHIIQVGHTIPDITFLYNMWYRDLIDDSGLEHGFEALGYPEGFIEPLKTLAFFIPPVQDLITMAVREVFSPEIAQAQGQFEDFPPEFAKFARQQGVSDEWAKNYWAAHWSLPSVQMGYEMMHRGVITQDRLKELLRALDVMPFWRQPLIDISFRPFTRVDIRRMHRVDVLTDQEVFLSYKDLGYSDTKAGLLRDFVLEINKDDEILTTDIASDLTRSSILNFYKDGIIDSTVATALLIQAGINAAAAALFILGADFDLERAGRKQLLNIVLDEFRFGALTFFEAADRITALDFETRERELALLDLETLRVREIKQPSKADLDKFLRARLITDTEYLAQLDRIGYAPHWADKYLSLVGTG